MVAVVEVASYTASTEKSASCIFTIVHRCPKWHRKIHACVDAAEQVRIVFHIACAELCVALKCSQIIELSIVLVLVHRSCIQLRWMLGTTLAIRHGRHRVASTDRSCCAPVRCAIWQISCARWTRLTRMEGYNSLPRTPGLGAAIVVKLLEQVCQFSLPKVTINAHQR